LHLSCTIDSDLGELGRVKQEVTRMLTRLSPSQQNLADTLLIVEEVLSNIVRHGHGGEGGHEILLDVNHTDGMLTLRFEDSAPAFDPTAHTRAPAAQPDDDGEAMPMGGVGIVLVRGMAETVDYQRRDGRNCLTVRQRMSRDA
jgi:sigma-B regulation protein RsbU (phosphoserine phosphatase)